MKKKIRIAIYSRKSKYSEKGDSVGNQVEISLQYIETHYPNSEYDVETVIYEDDGFSGGNIERPKFKEFLAEENRNPFNILICYRLDRISRNIADFSSLINRVTELGTSFVSIKEQFDTKTPMGRAMMYIASVFAQLEREVIAERIRDNMIELAKTGRWLGGNTPLGYTSKRIDVVDVYEQTKENYVEKKKKTASKLIIINEEVEVVEKIVYKFLELKSLNKLESYFLKNKILTRNNIDFSVTTLRSILTNPVYVANDQDILEYFKNKGITIYADDNRKQFDGKYGLIAYGKKDNNIEDWIIAVGLHKPILKGIVWIRVQKLLEKNKEKRYRAQYKHNFLFSGILKCSECGSFMRPKIAKGERFYYVCELKEKSRGKRCKGKNISGIALDKLTIQKLESIVIPKYHIYNELSKMELKKEKREVKTKEELNKKLQENENTIQNLINKLKYIDIEIVDLINIELKKLKDQNKKIKEELLQLNTNQEEIVLDITNNYIKMFENLDIKSKKDILKMIIKEMKGNGKNIDIKLLDITINIKDKMLF